MHGYMTKSLTDNQLFDCKTFGWMTKLCMIILTTIIYVAHLIFWYMTHWLVAIQTHHSSSNRQMCNLIERQEEKNNIYKIDPTAAKLWGQWQSIIKSVQNKIVLDHSAPLLKRAWTSVEGLAEMLDVSVLYFIMIIMRHFWHKNNNYTYTIYTFIV